MLEFFRKYQRYFFIVIAVVIVISFSFFGTHQAITTPKGAQDRPIGMAVDGSQMRKKEIDEISRFLWSDRMDMQLTEKRVMPNFFNNGVIRKDFLSSGLGVMLVSEYFESIRGSFETRVEKHKHYHPYRHPTAPFISVESLWGQVLPIQKDNLDKFLKGNLPVDAHLFSLLVDLYLGETAFPPSILREYLMFQQKHYNWIQPDPALPQVDLNLFRCSSVEDWFGPDFMQLVSQFVHNAALIAKQKGYHVSREEARVDLFRNGYEALQVQNQSKEVDQVELSNLWKQQLMYLGMDEKAVLTVWQKVMLMRRLFEDYGHAALLDSHQYQKFHSYASKTALVDLYQLPPALQLKDFNTLLKLIYYSEAVSSGEMKGFELPKKFISVERAKEKCPELVRSRFLIEVAEVHKKDLTLNVSLKEMWDWQLDPVNFKTLEKEFPELAVSRATDAESFFAALEKLSPEVHNKLDQASRLKIVERHPEWIAAALDEAHMTTKEITIAPNGHQAGLAGLENALELNKLLSIAALKGVVESDDQAIEARSALEQYSADGSTYYRIQILDRSPEMALMTFAEANECGALDMLLDTHLEKEYQKLRALNPTPFKTEKEEWKPFHQVQNEVGRMVYKNILQDIDQKVTQVGVTVDQNRFTDLNGFYPKYSLYRYMQAAESDIRTKGATSSYLAKAELSPVEGKLSSRTPLEDQWKLTLETKVYKNSEKSPWFDESLFAMVEKGWSSVKALSDGKLSFFQLQEKQVPEETYLQEIKQGRQVLSLEAQRFLMVELLEELKAKDAIHLQQTDVE
ncbi:MAG: hypothetical protein H7A42_03010 [Chlamydiales bacterium]|nr:hypothetical protein [Chlamydiales bacterium]